MHTKSERNTHTTGAGIAYSLPFTDTTERPKQTEFIAINFHFARNLQTKWILYGWKVRLRCGWCGAGIVGPTVDMLNSKFDVISFCSSTARRWLNELFPFECISRFSNDFRWHLIKISCWVTRSEAGNAIEIAVVYDLFSRVECVHKLIHGAIECKRASVEHWWERDRRSEKTENLHDN